MTELLQRAIAEIERLSPDAQDAIATRILADLAEEGTWSARFAATSDDQWDRLAETVRRDIADGDSTPLDEVFPFRAPGA